MQHVAEGSWVGDAGDECRGKGHPGLCLSSPFLLMNSTLILGEHDSVSLAAPGTFPEAELMLPKALAAPAHLAAPAYLPSRFDPKTTAHISPGHIGSSHILHTASG